VRVAGTPRQRDGLVAGRVLLALDAGHIEPADWPTLRHLMRRVLKRHLGERPLASEALFRALRRGNARAGAEAERPDPPSNQDPVESPASNKESHHG
jgi:hypothetical protein